MKIASPFGLDRVPGGGVGEVSLELFNKDFLWCNQTQLIEPIALKYTAGSGQLILN